MYSNLTQITYLVLGGHQNSGPIPPGLGLFINDVTLTGWLVGWVQVRKKSDVETRFFSVLIH